MSTFKECDGPGCSARVQTAEAWDESDEWYELSQGDHLSVSFHTTACLAAWVSKHES